MTKNHMDLVDAIERERDEDRRVELVARLVFEIHEGRPVRDVVPLLGSASETSQQAAIWIVAEVGERARELWSYVPRLLGSRLPIVRYYALSFVLNCAGTSDGRDVSRALRLLEDSDRDVRGKAARFLVLAKESILEAARDHLLATDPASNSVHARGLPLLLADAPIDERVRLLQDAAPILKRYGVAGAIRYRASVVDALSLAEAVEDEEAIELVKEFIESRGWANLA